MNDEIIEIAEQTPVLKPFYLRFLAYLIAMTINLGPFILALFVWMMMDWFYALAALLLLYILFGIASSKLRQLYIPFTQRERSYSAFELASWMLAFHFPNNKETEDE